MLKRFGAASKGGVPMPNIPQMSSVWGDLGAAWVRSTKGSGVDPGHALVHRRFAEHRAEDRLIDMRP